MMPSAQADLFPETKPPRAKPLKRAHVIDAGEGMGDYPYGAQFGCKRCGWESDWLCFDNLTEIRRGLPCPNCNGKKMLTYADEPDLEVCLSDIVTFKLDHFTLEGEVTALKPRKRQVKLRYISDHFRTTCNPKYKTIEVPASEIVLVQRQD